MTKWNKKFIRKIAEKRGLIKQDIIYCEICINYHRFNFREYEQVHHIDGNRYNNDESNLMLVCKDCHRKQDKIRREMEKTISQFI